jgi:hypothetical protein
MNQNEKFCKKCGESFPSSQSSDYCLICRSTLYIVDEKYDVGAVLHSNKDAGILNTINATGKTDLLISKLQYRKNKK